MSASAYIEEVQDQDGVNEVGQSAGNKEPAGNAGHNAWQGQPDDDESDDREYVGDVSEEELDDEPQHPQEQRLTQQEIHELMQMMTEQGALAEDDLHDDEEELDDDDDDEEEHEQHAQRGGPSRQGADNRSGGAQSANELSGRMPMQMSEEQQQMFKMLMSQGNPMMGSMPGDFARMFGGQPAQQQERPSGPPATGPPPKGEWKGLSTLPEATQRAYLAALQQLVGAGKQQLTALIIGCSGVGKSATVNNIIGEGAIDLKPLMDAPPKASSVTRSAGGVTLRLLDIPPLTDGDKVSARTMDMMANLARTEGQIDVVLYVDRLDGERVGPLTKQVLSAVTDTLGRDVWHHTILALTRAESLPVNGGRDAYESYCNNRAASLRKAMYDCGAPKSAAIPLVLIDNRSGCPKDAEGQKVLPDGRCWLPLMVHEMVQLAIDNESPYVYNPKQRGANNPNRRFKWLIPLLIVAQIAFKIFVLDRILEEDDLTGDAYGPYNSEYIEEERLRRRVEAEEEKKAAERKAAKAAKKKTPRTIINADKGGAVEIDDTSDSDSNSDSNDDTDD